MKLVEAKANRRCVTFLCMKKRKDRNLMSNAALVNFCNLHLSPLLRKCLKILLCPPFHYFADIIGIGACKKPGTRPQAIIVNFSVTQMEYVDLLKF